MEEDRGDLIQAVGLNEPQALQSEPVQQRERVQQREPAQQRQPAQQREQEISTILKIIKPSAEKDSHNAQSTAEDADGPTVNIRRAGSPLFEGQDEGQEQTLSSHVDPSFGGALNATSTSVPLNLRIVEKPGKTSTTSEVQVWQKCEQDIAKSSEKKISLKQVSWPYTSETLRRPGHGVEIKQEDKLNTVNLREPTENSQEPWVTSSKRSHDDSIAKEAKSIFSANNAGTVHDGTAKMTLSPEVITDSATTTQTGLDPNICPDAFGLGGNVNSNTINNNSNDDNNNNNHFGLGNNRINDIHQSGSDGSVISSPSCISQGLPVVGQTSTTDPEVNAHQRMIGSKRRSDDSSTQDIASIYGGVEKKKMKLVTTQVVEKANQLLSSWVVKVRANGFDQGHLDTAKSVTIGEVSDNRLNVPNMNLLEAITNVESSSPPSKTKRVVNRPSGQNQKAATSKVTTSPLVKPRSSSLQIETQIPNFSLLGIDPNNISNKEHEPSTCPGASKGRKAEGRRRRRPSSCPATGNGRSKGRRKNETP